MVNNEFPITLYVSIFFLACKTVFESITNVGNRLECLIHNHVQSRHSFLRPFMLGLFNTFSLHRNLYIYNTSKKAFACGQKNENI